MTICYDNLDLISRTFDKVGKSLRQKYMYEEYETNYLCQPRVVGWGLEPN
jgi:hypothetical protein